MYNQTKYNNGKELTISLDHPFLLDDRIIVEDFDTTKDNYTKWEIIEEEIEKFLNLEYFSFRRNFIFWCNNQIICDYLVNYIELIDKFNIVIVWDHLQKNYIIIKHPNINKSIPLIDFAISKLNEE